MIKHIKVKNARCATRINNKVSETFSDGKFSTASLQSSTGKVILNHINYSTDVIIIMTCNITMSSSAYVNSSETSIL